MPILDVCGLRLQGVSIGGIETCVEVPSWKLAFDVGRCPESAVARRRVLFTHPHMDHMGGVATHAATRALKRMEPPLYVVPAPVAADFAALFDIWRRLDGSELPHRLVPLGPGDELDLGKGLCVRPFATVHRVPSQGYLIVRRHKQLREELRELPGSELERRNRAGEVIDEPVETPLLAYTGDTRIEVLDRQPHVLRAKVLWLETTFLDDRVSVERARGMGHTHLDEVIERADRFENERIVLGHVSARYGTGEIAEILARRLPERLRGRVVCFPPTRSRLDVSGGDPPGHGPVRPT